MERRAVRDHNNPLCDKFPFLSIAQHLSPLLSAALYQNSIFHSTGLIPSASAPLLQDKAQSGKEQPDNRRLLSMRDVS